MLNNEINNQKLLSKMLHYRENLIMIINIFFTNENDLKTDMVRFGRASLYAPTGYNFQTEVALRCSRHENHVVQEF